MKASFASLERYMKEHEPDTNNNIPNASSKKLRRRSDEGSTADFRVVYFHSALARRRSSLPLINPYPDPNEKNQPERPDSIAYARSQRRLASRRSFHKERKKNKCMKMLKSLVFLRACRKKRRNCKFYASPISFMVFGMKSMLSKRTNKKFYVQSIHKRLSRERMS